MYSITVVWKKKKSFFPVAFEFYNINHMYYIHWSWSRGFTWKGFINLGYVLSENILKTMYCFIKWKAILDDGICWMSVVIIKFYEKGGFQCSAAMLM